MFGNDFQKSVLKLKEYILEYGVETVPPYFNCLLYDKMDNEKDVISTVVAERTNEENKFIPGISEQLTTKIVELQLFDRENRQEHITHFFADLFLKTVTLTNQGDSDSLHLIIFIPLYKSDIWEKIKPLLEIISSTPYSYQIDILGLAADMASIFVSKNEETRLPLLREEYVAATSDNIHKIVEYKNTKQGTIANFFLLQNCQQEGLSLNLNIDSYTRIIGEFSLLCIEHYPDLFERGSIASEPIKAIGLSVLNFDRYYIIEYLLQRTYIHIMDREHINDDKIDVDAVSLITQDKLDRYKNLVSDFYNKEVQPLLASGQKLPMLIPEINTKLDEYLSGIRESLPSFLFDQNKSLPFKRAALAYLLGDDDEVLSNYTYDDNILSFDDLEVNAAQPFLDINNELLRTDNESQIARAILSHDREPADLHLEEMRKLHRKMLMTTTYIRNKEEEVKSLANAQQEEKEAAKRLSDGKFIYEDCEYKLVPININEKPLDDTYESTKEPSKSVDLREGFTDVKDQKSLGACLSFALVGVYEYILKTNNKVQSLSEMFLYYNTRKREGKIDQDSGTSIYESIASLMVDGICQEKEWEYDEKNFTVDPSLSAKEDGRHHLVHKAMNVNCELKDIKCALTEGYPVVISLNLYNSFVPDKAGFIKTPTPDDVSQEYGAHAMILCGFSDEEKVFIVRNSWSTRWGKDGYCFIPYSYVGNNDYLNMACIITEVDDFHTTGSEKKVKLNFDSSDVSILYAIKKNLIEESKLEIIELKNDYDLLRNNFWTIIQTLGNPSNRELLQGQKESLHRQSHDSYVKNQSVTKDNKDKELAEFDKQTKHTLLRIGGCVLIIYLLLAVSFYVFRFYDVISFTPTWYSLIVSFVLIASAAFLYYPYRTNLRRQLVHEFNEKIVQWGERGEQEILYMNKVKLNLTVNGKFMDGLIAIRRDLLKKLMIMRSFTGNLVTWYENEKKSLSRMDSATIDPFLSVISNDVLDKYFESQKDLITANIRLSDFIRNYELSESGIIAFQKNIKNTVISEIKKLVSDFQMYKYVSGDANYGYLNNGHTNLSTLLPLLDERSKVFLQLNLTDRSVNPFKLIFIRADEEKERDNWEKIIPESFSSSGVPSNIYIESPYKTIVLRILNLNLSEVVIAQYHGKLKKLEKKVKKGLYIGVGGTGIQTLLLTKKRIQDSFDGNIPPFVSFLGIDTDVFGLNQSIESGGRFISLSLNERCLIGGNINAYYSDNKDGLFWMPEGNAKFLRLLSNHGAGQIRSNGRLSLLADYDAVEKIVHGKYIELQEYNSNIEDRFKIIDSTVDVHIIYSLAGGTGSGAFLDLAYLVRKELVECVGKIIGYAVLPDVFRKMGPASAMLRVGPNSYAAIQELDFLMSMNFESNPVVWGTGDAAYELCSKPFDKVFLIDNKSLNLDVLKNIQDIADIIGIYLSSICMGINSSNCAIENNIVQLAESGCFDIKGKKAWAYGLGSSEYVVSNEKFDDYVKSLTDSEKSTLFTEIVHRASPLLVYNYSDNENIYKEDQIVIGVPDMRCFSLQGLLDQENNAISLVSTAVEDRILVNDTATSPVPPFVVYSEGVDKNYALAPESFHIDVNLYRQIVSAGYIYDPKD